MEGSEVPSVETFALIWTIKREGLDEGREMALEGNRWAGEQQGCKVAAWGWQVAGKLEVQTDARFVPSWMGVIS